MARHVWTVLCNQVIFDQDTGNASLINVIESIQLHGTPPNSSDGTPVQLPVKIAVVSYVIREDRSAPEIAFARASLLAPHGDTVERSEVIKIDLSNVTRARTVGTQNHFHYVGAGIYEQLIELSDDQVTWQEVARVPIEVVVTAQE
ncbi:MAG: hypothetical protein ACR2KU_07580 [Gammaproteobacteria bacterium]